MLEQSFSFLPSETAGVITAAQAWLETLSFQSQAHPSLSYFLFLSSFWSSRLPSSAPPPKVIWMESNLN